MFNPTQMSKEVGATSFWVAASVVGESEAVQNSNKIKINNLPPNVRTNDLWQLFGKEGTVKSVYLKIRDEHEERSFAFVEFENSAQANQACIHQNHRLMGSFVIDITLHPGKNSNKEQGPMTFKDRKTKIIHKERRPESREGIAVKLRCFFCLGQDHVIKTCPELKKLAKDNQLQRQQAATKRNYLPICSTEESAGPSSSSSAAEEKAKLKKQFPSFLKVETSTKLEAHLADSDLNLPITLDISQLEKTSDFLIKTEKHIQPVLIKTEKQVQPVPKGKQTKNQDVGFEIQEEFFGTQELQNFSQFDGKEEFQFSF